MALGRSSSTVRARGAEELTQEESHRMDYKPEEVVD